MDLRMPRCDGVEATRLLREQQPDVAVVVLTTYEDDRPVLDALRAGARGYLTKDASAEQIRAALQQVRTGRAVIDPAVPQDAKQFGNGGRVIAGYLHGAAGQLGVLLARVGLPQAAQQRHHSNRVTEGHVRGSPVGGT